MTIVEFVICISLLAFVSLLVGGIALAMRFQRIALEKEAEKRIALVRQQLREANKQIDELEMRSTMCVEVMSAIEKIENELRKNTLPETTECFIQRQLLDVRVRMSPFLEEA